MKPTPFLQTVIESLLGIVLWPISPIFTLTVIGLILYLDLDKSKWNFTFS